MSSSGTQPTPHLDTLAVVKALHQVQHCVFSLPACVPSRRSPSSGTSEPSTPPRRVLSPLAFFRVFRSLTLLVFVLRAGVHANHRFRRRRNGPRERLSGPFGERRRPGGCKGRVHDLGSVERRCRCGRPGGFEQHASRAMADTLPGCSGGTGAGDAGLRHVFACIGR